ncbi:hypothetical protein ASE01_07060 [Nocardioides sp. Root190]|uniref:hypothetical protein n=1 Tax=Nocardioides sp. Root190 TaxID=1736488 RepID=UPI0006F363D6|nr:hypothetical protein [Nocardioides sp. Root190]KRB77932.1 hypothetical protein ASE01_07060 [Nocardioides sp. Root190]
MTYDAALHLLDRQIVDEEGRLLAKVDDVELRVDPDGSIRPSGLLVGMPAVLPRLGRRVGHRLTRLHVELRPAAEDRGRPLVVDIDRIASLTSEVRLSGDGRGSLRRLSADRAAAGDRWRLGELLGTPAAGPGLHRKSVVLDVRISGRPGESGEHRVAALVVGPGRSGALLGYDRTSDLGPALIAAVVRWMHRHARVVELGPEVEIDCAAGRVRIGAGASFLPLRG